MYNMKALKNAPKYFIKLQFNINSTIYSTLGGVI